MKPLIRLYSKAGCAVCAAAKDKLAKMGLDFTELDAEYYKEPHKGWRYDLSVKVRAAMAMNDERLPLFEIDGGFYSYPEAMLALKGYRKQAEENRP